MAVRHSSIVELSESPLEAPSLLKRLISHRISELPWRSYLNPDRVVLRLAQLWSIDPDRILVTRGAQGAIDLWIHHFARTGGAISWPTPAFPGYARAANRWGLVKQEYRPSQDWQFDDPPSGHFFWGYPGNPIGSLRLPNRRSDAILDCAHLPLLGVEVRDAVANDWNVVASASKVYGLAAARLGVLVAADISAARALKKLSPTFDLDAFQAAAWSVILENALHARLVDHATRILKISDRCRVKLEDIGFSVVHATHNFVTVQVTKNLRSCIFELENAGFSRFKVYESDGLIRVSLPSEPQAFSQESRESIRDGSGMVIIVDDAVRDRAYCLSPTAIKKRGRRAERNEVAKYDLVHFDPFARGLGLPKYLPVAKNEPEFAFWLSSSECFVLGYADLREFMIDPSEVHAHPDAWRLVVPRGSH